MTSTCPFVLCSRASLTPEVQRDETDEEAVQQILTYRKDNHELLLFILKNMISEQTIYLENKYRAVPDYVEVKQKDFV
ncbi:DNA replication licensing factor mcm2 [Orchesella cincta]|uniref:DNA replication licensing factor mcm2 n=1 Tax=Orchesella cincta TaxID=48709 RepID=A0A1D2MG97_ORCCI|nr:DNA replication licensing factor mcm2 [Orchesella cincta]